MVKLNFDRVYPIDFREGTISHGIFTTTLQEGRKVNIAVKVSDEYHVMYNNVYNLAFGPTDHMGRINDLEKLAHADHSLVFSTILNYARCYLEEYPDRTLGIDGSTYSRALLYYRMIYQNYDYLTRYFKIYGITNYVRISRIGKYDYENPFDFDDIQSLAVPIEREKYMEYNDRKRMFNYFIFKLKK